MKKLFTPIQQGLADLFATLNSYWSAVSDGTKGAIIGALAALAVAYVQDWQERRRNDEQQRSGERNKLRYLHFLIQDSYKTIESYDRNAQMLAEKFKENPFEIPSTGLYAANSMNLITNKINQEDYYLAALNQIEGNDISEIFLVYNALNENYTMAVEHYKKEFPALIESKESYYKALDQFRESLNQYSIKNAKKLLLEDEKNIYREIDALIGTMKAAANTPRSRNEFLRDSRVEIIDPVIKILDPRGQETNRELMIEAYEVREAYWMYISHMRNVVGDAQTSREIMNRLKVHIKNISVPLDNYVKEFDKK